MGKGLLDLEKHFAFYGAYHSNSVNVLIHIFFVWPIFFSSLILFDFSPPILHVPVLGGFDLNFSFFFALFYAVFYISPSTGTPVLWPLSSAFFVGLEANLLQLSSDFLLHGSGEATMDLHGASDVNLHGSS